MSSLIFVTLVLMPFIWSTLVSGLRRVLRQGAEIPDDGMEKGLLAILVAPIVIGMILLVLSRYKPIPLPDMQTLITHLSLSHASADLPKPVAVGVLMPHSVDILAWLVIAGWGIYAMGVVIKAVPLVLAFARLRRVVSLSRPSMIAGEMVRVTEAPVPPLAWGRSIILLPENLTTRFSNEDLQMIIHHERAHLHRGDTIWFAILGWVDALLWFNPFIRQQTARCRMAAEIACDAAVTRVASADTYARVLVRTLKHTAGDVRQYAPAVFSNVKSGDYRMRIRQIMHAGPAVRKSGRRALYAMLAVAAVPVLSAQFAWAQGVQVKSPAEDLSIYAPGDGTVSRVFVDTNTWSYGEGIKGRVHPLTIEIDHGDGFTSTYTLTNEKTDFKVGDQVVAGQLITKSGGEDHAYVKGMGCLKAMSCDLSGGNGYSFKGGGTVMSHMVEFRRNGRVLRTDIFYYDPKEDIGIAQGHIKIGSDADARIMKPQGTGR